MKHELKILRTRMKIMGDGLKVLTLPPPYLGGYGMGMARVFLRVDRHCVGAAYFSSGRAKKVFTKRVRRMRVAGAGAKNKLRSTRWAA
jgi:hypothetical protein